MKRLDLLPRWLAGAYLCWSLLVYFGTLKGDAHNWWPAFLYPIVWPWGIVESHMISSLGQWLVSDPKSASESTSLLLDHISGAFYIVGGTFWIWLLAHILSFPIKHLVSGSKSRAE